MFATASTMPSVVSTLAWVIPVGGLVVWILILPSTRALLKGRLERKTPTPETSLPKEEPVSTPKHRSEDSEIRHFNRDLVRAKYTRTDPASSTR